MRIMYNFLSAKKKVNSDLIRTQHMWVDSANKKYSELESL